MPKKSGRGKASSTTAKYDKLETRGESAVFKDSVFRDKKLMKGK